MLPQSFDSGMAKDCEGWQEGVRLASVGMGSQELNKSEQAMQFRSVLPSTRHEH